MHQRFFILALFLSLVGCGGGNSSSQPTTDASQPTTGTSQPVATSGQQPKSFNLLSIEASANKVKTFKFEWQESKGASSYTLCKKDTSTENDCLILKDDIISTSYEYTLDDLLNSQVPYFVIAKNSSGKILSNERNLEETALTAATGFLKASGNEDHSKDMFGLSVALSSDSNTLAIGAPGYQDHSGAVYVFTRQGAVWSQQLVLNASDPAPLADFGVSVSLSADGNTLAIGAYNEDEKQKDSGAVYIFTRQGLAWNEQQKLKASDIGADDSFGLSISLSDDGNILAIGASRDDGDDSGQQDDSGAVYIFTREDSAWSEQQKLQASDINAKDLFGISVSLNSDGNTLAISSSGSLERGSGSVYIFTQQDSAWTQQQKIQPLDIDKFDAFGLPAKLSPDGNTLAAGAPGDEHDSGAVYLFTRQDSAWTQQQKIKPSDITPDSGFGATISLNADGNMLAVGAINIIHADNEQRVNSGAVYIYTRENSLWQQQQKFKISGQDENTIFGVSVTLSADGKTLAAGAPAMQDDAGVAYIF